MFDFFKILCHLWCHKIFVRHLALLPDPEKTSKWQGGFQPIITIKSDSDKRYINNHYLQKGSGSFGSGQGPSWYKPILCPTWQFLDWSLIILKTNWNWRPFLIWWWRPSTSRWYIIYHMCTSWANMKLVSIFLSSWFVLSALKRTKPMFAPLRLYNAQSFGW